MSKNKGLELSENNENKQYFPNTSEILPKL